MEDPFLEIKKLSNPARVWLFTKEEKRILLLGDLHTEQVAECDPCPKPVCFDYVGLLKKLEEYHKETNTDLDVYVEVFAPDHPEQFLDRIKQASKEVYSTAVFYLTGFSRNLKTARTKLLPKLFFHDRKEGIGQRFHYIDFRGTNLFSQSGFDLKTLIKIAYSKNINKDELLENFETAFKKKYPTKSDIRKKINTILFSQSLSTRGKSRIAKQFYKLGTNDQKLVRSFAVDELDSILKQHDYNNTLLLVLDILTFSTDIYAIARFLRFFHRQVPNSTSVFLSGLAHSERYVRFLKAWKAKQVFTSKRINLSKTFKHSKCIKVKLHQTRRKKK